MVDSRMTDRHTDGARTGQTGSSTHGQPSTKVALPEAQALLELKVETENSASTCAILTPMIKAKLSELHSGQVLEVRVNDPTAREDIASWSRLSGNQLLAMAEEGHAGLRFFLKKK